MCHIYCTKFSNIQNTTWLGKWMREQCTYDLHQTFTVSVKVFIFPVYPLLRINVFKYFYIQSYLTYFLHLNVSFTSSLYISEAFTLTFYFLAFTFKLLHLKSLNSFPVFKRFFYFEPLCFSKSFTFHAFMFMLLY